ncbi:ABC transporter ATP-binding protein [Conexibacter arvalis]|uniref:Peptide/nickel transport system ATP-binding protein n=1 Tax=Conexibacter arvalis TaxID=912552 RepID=A0A840I7P8_9ACTN|nr:ABC transporter ATP-binding protein [Conexibacter arvalis]MBB4660542.1 peptide/nickel transport system ATP-binding protein [Conexibacter arvalis]
MAERDEAPLLDVRGLEKTFPGRRGRRGRRAPAVRAVDGISFDLRRGETLGLVGESGSGKSTAARAILRLLQPTGGQVVFDGEDIARLGRRELRSVRPRMQMVFQDPYSSLNPRMTVGEAIREALRVNRVGDRGSRAARLGELLELVGLDAHFAGRYPHQMSGGQRQRVGIARALATEPELVFADEALSALDVSIQAQIANLLVDLRDELELTLVFISHDLRMVRHISHRIAVMYLGRIVELGDAEQVWSRPAHPYTASLLAAVPSTEPEAAGRRLEPVAHGERPDLDGLPDGCRFHPRCPLATDLCRVAEPEIRDVGTDGAPQLTACHHAELLFPAASAESAPTGASSAKRS